MNIVNDSGCITFVLNISVPWKTYRLKRLWNGQFSIFSLFFFISLISWMIYLFLGYFVELIEFRISKVFKLRKNIYIWYIYKAEYQNQYSVKIIVPSKSHHLPNKSIKAQINSFHPASFLSIMYIIQQYSQTLSSSFILKTKKLD